VSAEVHTLVEYLINSLDDRGYLVTEAEARAKELAARGGEDEAAGEDGDEDDEGAIGANGNGKGNGKPVGEAPLPKPILPETHPAYKEIQGVIDGSHPLAEASMPVREAFHVLHGMEPAGIGARNLRECLLIQIRRSDRISPLARRIVEEEFELLEKLKIAAIAKKFDVPPDQIQAAMKEIGALQPHPGRLVSASVANPVTPDLIVEEVEGELVLMLNDRTVPSLKVSRAYTEMLKKGSRASNEEKKFVREKLNSATWLIRAIEQRKSTMLKVMQAIIESQPDFFKQGPTHLRPLILQDVADKIGMHISTVSRVTNGKYVQTSHGIFELKYFFTAGVTQADGREISSVTTKDEIKQLIDGEDPKRPLSDQKIVEILKAKGLDVARRTVAKYRDQLEILPARLRRQY
jgi:RNA polymerase sigma-54 factor